MKKVIRVGAMYAVFIAVLGLTGCSVGGSAEVAAANLTSSYVTLPDGRTVLCVMAILADGGVSCDWANAK